MRSLDNIKGSRILVVGDVMLDRYWWGVVDRISPEAPVPIVRLEKTSLVVGGAANVAANLVGLGAIPCLFGVTGKDSEADALNEKLSVLGISSDNITAIEDRPTTIKTRVVAHSQHVVRIDQEFNAPISDEKAQEILKSIVSVAEHVDGAIISDYAKGMLTDKLLQGIIVALRALDKPIFVDPKRRDLTIYSGATAITPNKREAADACGLSVETKDLSLIAGNTIKTDLGASAVLITEGEDGMTLFHENGEDHLRSHAQNVFDVTGAGDTVIATFAAAASTGSTFVDAAKLANVAAGIVVGKIGTTTITDESIVEFDREHETGLS